MCVTWGAPAVRLTSRTLGFVSSMFLFLGLCSAEDWATNGLREKTKKSKTAGSHPLAGVSPCVALWLLKVVLRRLTRDGAPSNFAAFDIGVSVFGPLCLNFITLARSDDEGGSVSFHRPGQALCLVEAMLGVALGNSELVAVASVFLVPFTLWDIGEVAGVDGGDLPVCAFALSLSAILASSWLAKEGNREEVAQLLQNALLVTD